MPDNPPPVAGPARDKADNGPSVALALPHPAGRLAVATPQSKARLSRQAKAGTAVRVAPNVYIVGADLSTEQAVAYHRTAIIGVFWPGAVLSNRTALTGGMPFEGWIFITHPDPIRRSDLELPGVTVSPRIGPGALPGDTLMPDGLHISGPARRLVENIGIAGRPPLERPSRQAGTEMVEDEIDKVALHGGAGAIQNVLSQLDAIASQLPTGQVEMVRSRLAAVLGSFSDATPTSERLAARLAGEPYDEHRLSMFRSLAELLDDTAPEPRPALGPPTRWMWEPFFEAYFSNFIEGTEFGVEEARQIAIDGVIPSERPADAHDVSATYKIISDPATRALAPASADQLLDQLRGQHRVLLEARPEKRPGEFKERRNYAGDYAFVEPDLVIGTLRRGFGILGSVTDPMHRALALMLLITECHPFDDGNGRIARIMSNGVLSAAGQVRIVIPTVYRNNYIAGLAGVSNGSGRGETLIAVLRFAQKWTGAIDWTTFEAADEHLRRLHAYMDPALADATGISLRLPPSVAASLDQERN
ncbi:MAG: Fic family protein [Acidimicrobiales bacterium]